MDLPIHREQLEYENNYVRLLNMSKQKYPDDIGALDLKIPFVTFLRKLFQHQHPTRR